MGCAPPTGPLTIIQVKRWTTGLLEIFFSRKNPIILSLTSNLKLRQGVVYTWVQTWGFRAVAEMLYSLLPAYCIISSSTFLPNVDQPAFVIPVLILLIYVADTLSDYFRCGLSVRAWWNNERIGRIYSTTANFFGLIALLLKLLGISETVFEVTSKGASKDGVDDAQAGRFTFNESPMFVPATTLVLINLGGVGLGFGKMIWALVNGLGWNEIGIGIGELSYCVLLLLVFSPFVKGLFGKGNYGIPFVTILKSLAFAVAFFSLGMRN